MLNTRAAFRLDFLISDHARWKSYLAHTLNSLFFILLGPRKMNAGKPQPYRDSTQNIQQDPTICVFGECGKETGDEMHAGVIQIVNSRLLFLKLKSLNQL